MFDLLPCFTFPLLIFFLSHPPSSSSCCSLSSSLFLTFPFPTSSDLSLRLSYVLSLLFTIHSLSADLSSLFSLTSRFVPSSLLSIAYSFFFCCLSLSSFFQVLCHSYRPFLSSSSWVTLSGLYLTFSFFLRPFFSPISHSIFARFLSCPSTSST